MTSSRQVVLAALLIADLAPAVALSAGGPGSDPVAVFADLGGVWEGVFVGWDAKGVELYRLRVRQVYRTIDANTQEVSVTDTSADGAVIHGRGRNVARRRADGSLELRCVVEKSNGERVEHRGTLGTTPDGHAQITWWSQGEGRQEVFREVVRGAVYTIDGVGRYGDATVVMAGRYSRLEEELGVKRNGPGNVGR